MPGVWMKNVTTALVWLSVSLCMYYIFYSSPGKWVLFDNRQDREACGQYWLAVITISKWLVRQQAM